jgi:hypothetical protein
MTDADPHAMGIEGLAARLRRLGTHIDQVTKTLDRLGVVGDPDPDRDAVIEGVRKEHARQLNALRTEQVALRDQLEEDMFPVIKIDAGRYVELILNRGVSLRLGEGPGEGTGSPASDARPDAKCAKESC